MHYVPWMVLRLSVCVCMFKYKMNGIWLLHQRNYQSNGEEVHVLGSHSRAGGKTKGLDLVGTLPPASLVWI